MIPAMWKSALGIRKSVVCLAHSRAVGKARARRGLRKARRSDKGGNRLEE